MSEIKEERSPFAEFEKQVVQDWLADPCTVKAREMLEGCLAECGRQLYISAKLAHRETDNTVCVAIRDLGTKLVCYEGVRDGIFDEAERYAK